MLKLRLLSQIYRPVQFCFGGGWVGFTLHQHCKGYMATFQLYPWRKTSGASLCIISGMGGDQPKTREE